MAVLLVKAPEAQTGICIGPTASNPVTRLRPSGFARIFILHVHIHGMGRQFADKLACQKKSQNLREIASETCPYENLNLLPFLCQTNIDFDPKLSNHSNRMCETVIVVSFGMVVSIRR